MGDVVTCTAVLKKNVDDRRPDILFLRNSKGDNCRIPCHPAGKKMETDVHPMWTYSVAGEFLTINPSLLVRTGKPPDFHTNNPWTVKFKLCPPNTSEYDYFDLINP